MFIQIFPSGPLSTNAYVASCLDTRHAVIIDPSQGSAPSILAYLKENALKASRILLTHSHWDHVADIPDLKNKLSLNVSVHLLDRENLEHPGSDGIPCWIPIQPVVADETLEDEQVIPVGPLEFRVIHTPGHSPGSVCFYHAGSHTLFSGDTLFKGSIGNLSFPTSQPALMWSSLAKLHDLPPQTNVYPGHGPQTTIGAESWLPNAQKLFS